MYWCIKLMYQIDVLMCYVDVVVDVLCFVLYCASGREINKVIFSNQSQFIQQILNNNIFRLSFHYSSTLIHNILFTLLCSHPHSLLFTLIHTHSHLLFTLHITLHACHHTIAFTVLYALTFTQLHSYHYKPPPQRCTPPFTKYTSITLTPGAKIAHIHTHEIFFCCLLVINYCLPELENAGFVIQKRSPVSTFQAHLTKIFELD